MPSTETIDKITPYAFTISPQLLGLPLARPWRRGGAMLVDLMLVAALANLPLWALMVSLVVTCWFAICQAKRQPRGWQRWISLMLWPVMAVMVLVAVEDITSPSEKAPAQVNSESSSESFGAVVAALSTVPSVMATRECQTEACWQPHLESITELLQLAASEPGDGVDVEQFAEQLFDESQLSGEQQSLIKAQLMTRLNAANAAMDTEPVDAVVADSEVADSEVADSEVAKDGEPPYRPLRWVRGFIEELGVSFGWAAFYFTVMTAWGNGQTLGKRCLGTQVVQLDNRHLSLWDAFGRYGGYSAGLATGLMGFLQIYWDPNRQAIQDKVSATVVVDRRRWLKQQAQQQAQQ